MTSEFNLPLELLPTILEHLPKVHYLTNTALVNHIFYQSTVPLLYSRASIYSWHKDAKGKVIQLFQTLSSCPHLARYVRRLEIRDFPRNSSPEKVVEFVSQGLRNCTNLRSCTWTRDGSLTSDVLLALAGSLPSTLHTTSSPVHGLRELEINGGHKGLYDPKLLLQFKSLEKISLIMPTAEVVQVLEEWVEVVQESLKSLNIICRVSTVITDEHLIRMAPYLKNLEFLHMTGCRRVSNQGIRAILDENERGIKDLGLESLSSRLDLSQLIPTSPSKPPTFHNLHSLTLSIPRLSTTPTPSSTPNFTPYSTPTSCPSLQVFTSTLSHILTHHTPNLERFQIYSPFMFIEPCLATFKLYSSLVKTHGERLKRISIHRMLIGSEVIREICEKCLVMEEFFIVVEPGGLDDLADCAHHARSLKTLHVNYPLEAQSEDGSAPVLRLEEALRFIKRCDNPSITQFGCNARVWLVNRRVVVRDDGEMDCEVYLGPYESPDIPEQFMVVRT